MDIHRGFVHIGRLDFRTYTIALYGAVMTTMTTYGAITPTNDGISSADGFGIDAEWDDVPPTNTPSPSSSPPRTTYSSPSKTRAYGSNAFQSPNGTDAAQPTLHESLADRRRDTVQRCTDAAKSAGKRLLFGMTTSLALQSVPIPDDCDLDLDVTQLHTVSSSDDRRKRLADPSITAHVWQPLTQHPDANVRINQHVYALDLFHTWAQLAHHLTVESLIVLADAIITAITRQPKLAQGRDAETIRRALMGFADTLPRFRGKRDCQTAALLIRAGADSPTETRERLSLLKHGLPEMVLNHVVSGITFRSGSAMTLDMAWPEHRVAVEYDGDHHRTDKAQWRRDQEKRDRLRSRGWLIFIATGATIADAGARAEFAFHVARALMSRGAEFSFRVLEAPIESVAREARKREAAVSALAV